MSKIIDLIDKYTTWILMVLVIIFVITGFGKTKHLMDPVLAAYIHTQILPIPFLILFCIHMLKVVRNQFWKWNLFDNKTICEAFAYLLTLVVTSALIWVYLR
ncbi:MAG: hypothetical protein HQL13_05100 [Candidatus Omnitrophica bacterium]|nr:hypothetical protein [Candidatus Omnitrophota bacterium]